MPSSDAPSESDVPTSAASAPAGWNTPQIERNILQIPAFRRMWAALGLASLGDWLGLLAITALAQNLFAGSYASENFAIAGVFLLRLVPAIVLGPFAGVVADRLDRRLTMVVSNLARGLILVSIPFVEQAWWLFLATLLMETASLFFLPSKDASIPNLVPREKLEAANSLNLVTTYGAALPAAVLFALLTMLGGALSNLFGVSNQAPITMAIWVNAALFFASALLIVPIREISGHGPAHGPRESIITTVWQGWRYLFTTPVVRGLVVGMLGAFAAGGTVVGLARTYVRDLGAGDPGYGLLFGVVFLGLALGMGVGPRLLSGFSRRRLFGLALTFAGVALTLLALIPNMVIVVILTLALGAGAGVAWVTGYTLLGLEVADELRGRTFAFVTTMARVVLVLVLATTPAIAAGLGGNDGHDLALGDARITYDGAALTMLLAGLLAAALGVVAYRRMDDRAGVSLRNDLFSVLPTATPPGVPGGFFLAFEGGEGTGKTTQSRRVAEQLRARGYDVVTTREPGGTPIGQRLREVLLDRESTGLSDRAEALLYAADRADHVERVIRPALDRGAIVITDRYIDSSLAYQGAGRTLPADEILRLSRWATRGLTPDLTIVFDLPPEVGLARAVGEADRLESESERFHTRVREAFLALARSNPGKYLVLDATGSPDAVTGAVLDRLAKALPPTTEEYERREAARLAARAAREAEEEQNPSSRWGRASRGRGRRSESSRRGVAEAAPAESDIFTSPVPHEEPSRSGRRARRSVDSTGPSWFRGAGSPPGRHSAERVTAEQPAIREAPPEGTLVDLPPLHAEEEYGPVDSRGRWSAPPSA